VRPALREDSQRQEGAAPTAALGGLTPSGWISSTFDSLSIPPYRVLWIGTVISFIAFMMSTTAQSFVAYDLTGNNRAVGSVMFGQGIAMLLLTPFGGAIADRVSKRFLLLLCQTTIGATMFAVGMLIFTGQITVFFLAAGAFITGMMFSFLGPTRTAYIGEIVPPERRGNAIALTQVGMNATRVAGPFMAGGLLAWPLVGSAGTYFVVAALFIFVVATLAQLPPTRPVEGRAATSVLSDIGFGVKHVIENGRLLQIVIGFVLITMLGFPYFVVLPGFTQDVLGAGTAGFGIMLGVSSIGGLVMSLAVASVADSRKAPLFLSLASFGLGVSLMLTGIAPTFVVALGTMMLVGGCGSAFQTLNNALALKLASPLYFGRVMSLMMLAWSLNGLIGLPIGFIADAFGERAVLVGMGAGVCAVALLLTLWQLKHPLRFDPPALPQRVR
jgi:MFS family permease